MTTKTNSKCCRLAMTQHGKLWYCPCGAFEFIAPDNYKDMKIKAYIRNKTGKVNGALWWDLDNDDPRRRGCEFTLRELTAYELAITVWRDYAFCALFGAHRRHSDFEAAYHICLDYDGDHGETMTSLADNEFIKSYASFIHTTTSHTSDKPRMHVVFLFSSPVTCIEEYKDIAAALGAFFPACETESIGSVTKPWSGAKDCEVVGIWQRIGSVEKDDLRKYGALLREAAKPAPRPKNERIRISGGDYEAYIKRCFDNAAGKLAECSEGNRNRPLNKVAFGLFRLSAANWNTVTADEVMSFLERETKGFWGGAHRATAESAMKQGVLSAMPEPSGRGYYIGVGEGL